MSDRITTAALKEALNVRFSGLEWARFFEVASGTGAQAGRSADMLAMNMFPSRGLRIHGVECKASRSDWLRELKNPEKAEAIQKFCDHWWIAAPKGIVKPEELPPTWGLLELNGKALRQTVAAPLLEAQPLTRAFIASLLRSASRYAENELRGAVDKQLQEAREQIDQRVSREVEMRTSSHKRLADDVAAFEGASGVKITETWHMGAETGAAVKLIREMGLTSIYGGVRSLSAQARKFADRADDLLSVAGHVSDEDE